MSGAATAGLRGHVAIVTGSGRGIRRAIALRIRGLPSPGADPTLLAILEAAEQP